jgi:hypothetical protein
VCECFFLLGVGGVCFALSFSNLVLGDCIFSFVERFLASVLVSHGGEIGAIEDTLLAALQLLTCLRLWRKKRRRMDSSHSQRNGFGWKCVVRNVRMKEGLKWATIFAVARVLYGKYVARI